MSTAAPRICTARPSRTVAPPGSRYGSTTPPGGAMQHEATATAPVRSGRVPVPHTAAHGTVDLDVTVPSQLQHLPLLRQTAWAFAVRHHAWRPDDVRLAVAEATMNAMRYAYPAADPGPVRLHGMCDG